MSDEEVVLGILPSRSVSSKEASLSISDACKLVESGDLVLFSDRSWSASFITVSCASRFSHLAIVYRPSGGRPLLLEAVLHPGKDIDVSFLIPESGVRLIDFENHLQHFRGKAVAIRIVLTRKDLNASKPLKKHMTSVMEKVWEETKGKPYETRAIDFLLSRFPFVEKRSENLDRFFCSKLVALCYIRAGLLDTSVMPSSFLPDDFSATGDVTLKYPTVLPFPGLSAKFSELIKFSDELYINTSIL